MRQARHLPQRWYWSIVVQVRDVIRQFTQGTPNCNTNPKATVFGIPKEPVLESAELITSRLTGAGSLLPPVYGEAWAKGHATGTPDSTFPRYGSPHTANMRVKESCISKREMKIIPYRNVLDCLSFLAGRTRPDISYAVNIFSQFQNDPGLELEHWYGLLKLFGYVNKTKHYKLRLDFTCINIVGFSDADFATNRDDRISMGGQFISLESAPVTWRTFNEKLVSLSTMEAEFMSIVECIKEITWLDNIMNECASRDLVKYANKPVLLADNQADIDFLKSPIENYRTKHIE
ncbi:retrovirus-related Pol polyprotein from transposon TNT 1-94 [Trichonephila clavipes]|nr:retrovirus-related Pol polyprotein from transposon TNT 1-94 [Trichonephila clavipes]